MKRIGVRDEYDVTWTVIETDPLFPGLAKLPLENDEFACWREDLIQGFIQLDIVVRQGLADITRECLAAEEPNDGLLRRLIHAAQAYTTRSFLVGSGED